MAGVTGLFADIMKLFYVIYLCLSFLSFFSLSAAEIHGVDAHGQRHRDISRRASNDLLRREEYTDIRATWYYDGL